MKNFFQREHARETHPLGSVTRDQLAVNASGGEAASVCRSVCPSVRSSFCHQCVARSHQRVGSLSFSALLSLSLSCMSFQDLSISLSLFLVPSSLFLLFRFCLASPVLRSSSRSLFPLSSPLLLVFSFLSVFRPLRTHTLHNRPFLSVRLSTRSRRASFLVNHKYIDVSNRES